jgi:hypothetical protein
LFFGAGCGHLLAHSASTFASVLYVFLNTSKK